MMKLQYRLLLLLVVIITVTIPAYSQSTTVTAKVLDPTGKAYANGSGGADFVPSPTSTTIPTVNGGSFQQSVVIDKLDAFGNFTITVTDNNAISDGHTGTVGSMWEFHFCDVTGVTCFPGPTLTITGSSMNITNQIQAVSAPLPATGGGGGITGSGAPNLLTKWTSSSVVGNSAVTDDGTTLTYNGTNAALPMESITGPRPRVDVTAYGAKGDAVTDDTAAIQAAINAACNSSGNPGGTVYFPPALGGFGSFYKVSQPQNSNNPVFTIPATCAGLHLQGGNQYLGTAGQFSRAPLVRINVTAGVNPGLGPVFLISQNSVTLENLSISGYNQALQIFNCVQVTLHNFYFAVADTNQPVGPATATDNCALCIYNAFWIKADQGAITVPNPTRDWAIVMAQINAANKNNAGLYHFTDIVETGPNLYDIRTNVTAAASTIEFNWVQIESVNGPFLTMMGNQGGSPGSFYPGGIYNFVNLFDCSGNVPLVALKANNLSYSPSFTASSSNCSSAGPLFQVFNLTYPSAGIVEVGGNWPVQAFEDENGNILPPFTMGNVNGVDYVTDTGNANRLRTDFETQGGGALGTPIRMIQKSKTQANLGVDPAAGVLFGDATNPGYTAALNQATRGTIDVQVATLTPPTNLSVNVAGGGLCGAGTYYWKITSATSTYSLGSNASLEISAVLGTNQEAQLSWTAAVGSAVANYVVYRATSAGFYGTQPYYTIGNVTSFTDTCAPPNGNGAPPVVSAGGFLSSVRLTKDGITLLGATSGLASIGVAAAAGTPSRLLLPITDPAAGQVLVAAAPSGGTVQTSWSAAGSGTVSTTGSPANGNLTKFSGSNTITNGDLSGDVTTSGSLVATVAKINGTSIPTNSAADQVINTTAFATGQWTAMPNCLDSGGNHINYSSSTHTFSCGATSSSGSTPPGSPTNSLQWNQAGSFAGITGTSVSGNILDITGTAGVGVIKRINNNQGLAFASAYPGADACAQINNAAASAEHVFADFTGSITCAGGFSIPEGVWVEMPGALTLTVGATVTLGIGSKLTGTSPGASYGTVLRAKNFLNSPIVKLGNDGHWQELQGLRIQGNSVNQTNVAIAAAPTGLSCGASNLVTVTTTSNHNLSVGNLVDIIPAGGGAVHNGFDGYHFTVLSTPTNTTFTYTLTGNEAPCTNGATGGGGTVYGATDGVWVNVSGETQVIHRVLVQDIQGDCFYFTGILANTGGLRDSTCFGATGWAYNFDQVVDNYRMSDVGDDANLGMVRINPSGGAGGVSVMISRMKEDSAYTTMSPNILIDDTNSGTTLTLIDFDLSNNVSVTCCVAPAAIKVINGGADLRIIRGTVDSAYQNHSHGYTNLIDDSGDGTLAVKFIPTREFPQGVINDFSYASVSPANHLYMREAFPATISTLSNGTNSDGQSISKGSTNIFQINGQITANYGLSGIASGDQCGSPAFEYLVDGLRTRLYNPSNTYNLYFTNEDSGSSPCHRIITGTSGTITIPPLGFADFQYLNPTSTIAAAPTGISRASNVVTVTTTASHNYQVGQNVTINNVFLSGSATIAASPNGAVRDSTGTTVTIKCTAACGVVAGQSATISGVTPSDFNGGPFVVTVGFDNTKFIYTQSGTANETGGGGTATFAGCATNPDGTFAVATVPSSTTFTYSQTGTTETCGNGDVSYGRWWMNSAWPVAPLAANLNGCSPSTAGSLCYWNGTAWTLLAGNNSGTNWLQETSAGVPSWTSPGGSPVWSSLLSPTGNLSLTMGSNTSTFNTTSALAQFFAWKNTTAATSGTSQGSPFLAACGRAWHGGADVEDCMTLSELPGNGTDAAITFNVGHTGTSTGTVTTAFPGPIQSGSSGGVGGTITLPEGTAATASSGNDVCYGDSTAHALKCSYNNGSFLNAAQTVASGTAALGTSAISSATCASVVTVSATGVLTTDVVTASFNGDPTAVTGYIPSTSGMLTIVSYPTANNVNFKVCNNTSGSITPGAITLNWRVAR